MSIFEYKRNKDSYIEEKLKSRSAKEAFKSAYNSLENFCLIHNNGKTLEQTLEELSHSGTKLEGNLWFMLQKYVNYHEKNLEVVKIE